MREFGWSIEYVLGLSYPVFSGLFGLIRRARLDASVDDVFIPYSAAKYGGKCLKLMLDGRGSFLLSDTGGADVQPVTPRMEKRAMQKLREIMQAKRDAIVEDCGE
ncbi:MAG: hypothetical protein PHI85_04935 [Victivallaceae bacterium]|nr:hypothetical protein [Victivallaceae bacterium]